MRLPDVKPPGLLCHSPLDITGREEVVASAASVPAPKPRPKAKPLPERDPAVPEGAELIIEDDEPGDEVPPPPKVPLRIPACLHLRSEGEGQTICIYWEEFALPLPACLTEGEAGGGGVPLFLFPHRQACLAACRWSLLPGAAESGGEREDQEVNDSLTEPSSLPPRLCIVVTLARLPLCCEPRIETMVNIRSVMIC